MSTTGDMALKNVLSVHVHVVCTYKIIHPICTYNVYVIALKHV